MTETATRVRDPVTPLWRGTITMRLITLGFALVAVIAHTDGYVRPWLAWAVFAVMTAWTAVTTVVYSREALRLGWIVFVDVLLTCGLMLLSLLILSGAQYAAVAPLSTTVWGGVPQLVAGARFGTAGGCVAGLALAGCTSLARMTMDLDVARDCFLLIASGLLVGAAATMARRSAQALAQAMRAEAATAERERLARSIHDSVLQILARVRRRGTELGGEAAELATLAGEQEIALRALVSSEPTRHNDGDTADLRAALHLLAKPHVHVSAPACEVVLPGRTVADIVAVVNEALTNVDKHAGQHANAWVLLEDLGSEVFVTIRDDGPGIPDGRLEQAAEQGHLGVASSINGRVTDLGGTVTLDTGEDAGTEWEIRVPRRKGESS